MVEIRKTARFAKWIDGQRDRTASGRITARIRLLSMRHAGDSKSLGEGLHELRLDIGPGYRVYYGYQGAEIIILLCGGDKGTQQRDIERARRLLKELG